MEVGLCITSHLKVVVVFFYGTLSIYNYINKVVVSEVRNSDLTWRKYWDRHLAASIAITLSQIGARNALLLK